jgi:hypothetical protein
MENQHNDDRKDFRHDHTAEEFATSNPNTSDPAEPFVPEFTEQQNKRLDTDPNRYANFANPDDENANREGNPNEDLNEDLSHYSTEDDRIQQPLVKDHQAAREQLENDTHSSDDEQSDKRENDRSEFFEGL